MNNTILSYQIWNDHTLKEDLYSYEYLLAETTPYSLNILGNDYSFGPAEILTPYMCRFTFYYKPKGYL